MVQKKTKYFDLLWQLLKKSLSSDGHFHWKIKNAQPMKDSFENNLISSKKTKIVLEWWRQNISTQSFYCAPIKRQIRNNSINSSKGAVFAENFNTTIRDFLKKNSFSNGLCIFYRWNKCKNK